MKARSAPRQKKKPNSFGGLFRAAMEAGAFGFSTTVLPQHLGFQGRPLPCRLASRDELSVLAGSAAKS